MLMKKYWYLLLFLSILFIPSNSFAQEQGTEELPGLESLLFEEIPTVYSSGFFARKITEAPGYTTVIRDEQIDVSPARDLRDIVLYNTPGISELMHENVGPTFAVRGVGVDTNAKTLVMLDGQHLNHRQHFGYATEMTSPLIGDIAQVEVVNGPGAIVHGSGAISGFVNMIPKNGADYPGLSTNFEWGLKEDLYKIESGYGRSYGPRRNFYVYAGILEAEGAKSGRPWVQDSTSVEADALSSLSTYSIRVNAFPDPTYKIACYWNHEDFSLNTFFREETWGLNGTYYRTAGGGETPSWMTASLGIRPKYTVHLSDTEEVDLISSILFMQQGHKGDSSGADSAENDKNMDTENHVELKVVGRTTRYEGHSTAAGFLLGRRGFKSDDAYIHSGSVDTTGEAQSSNWNEIGLFAEDIMNLTDQFAVSLGWRFDEVKYSPIKSLSSNYQPPDANNVSWRAATSYEIDSTSNIKLSYQEGFRYLDLAYLRWYTYYNQMLQSLGYPKLPDHEPETMSSTELNYHKELKDLKLKFDLNMYHNVYDKMLHWHRFSTTNHAGIGAAAVQAVIDVNDWMGCHLNAPGKFRTMGFEIMGTWAPKEHTLVKLSYGYSVPTTVPDDVYLSLNLFTEDKNHWTFYPEHQIKGTVMTSLYNDRLKLCFEPLFQSAMRRHEITGLTDIAYIYDHPRFIIDASAEYEMTKQASLKLVVKNLFEENVPPMTFKTKPYMGALGSEERWWYLTLKCKF